MKEYEYSKCVDDLKKYTDYCEKNDYILKEKISQVRTIYRKSDSTIARITINDNNGVVTKELDFKEDKLSSQELIIRRESLPLNFDDDSIIFSILEFLNYKKDNTIKRTRYIYENDKVKFEFDEYIEPDKRKVISIEGDKELVDKIWLEISNIN